MAGKAKQLRGKVQDACKTTDALTAEITSQISNILAQRTTADDFVTNADDLKDRAEANLKTLKNLESQLLPPRQNPKAVSWATGLGALGIATSFIPIVGLFIGVGLGVAAVAVGGKDVPEMIVRSGLRKKVVARSKALAGALHTLTIMIQIAAAPPRLPPP